MDFGFHGLNKSLNKNNNNDFNYFKSLGLDGLIIAVRVKSIILDNTHPRFKELGEWNSLGIIEYELVNSPSPINTTYPIAKPLDPNYKKYPLLNEIVYVISFPDNEIGKNLVSKKSYYINLIGVWNHPNHNAYPNNSGDIPSTQNKDYIETELGSTKKISNSSTKLKLGETFNEKSNIHPLLPFEGDIIYEGRWGNSIRFGSTVKNKPNEWSNSGNNGDPIIIIKNGQPLNSLNEGWIPIVEDVNNDLSSIYFTSTQKLPITVSNNIYDSYDEKPISPNNYEKEQILITSGRLVFNSKSDHILFSSPKSIGFSSKESINIDTIKTIVSSKKILLGSKNAKESIILGDKFLSDFNSLLTNINFLSLALQQLVSLPEGAPYISLIEPSTKLSENIKTIKTSLEKYKSKSSFTE